MRNRVAVMHGVNLDALDRRPAEHYGGLTLARLETRIEQFAQRARARGALLPDQPRGRVRRGAAQGRRLRRRAAAQPGRLDALRVVAPRRASRSPACRPSRCTSPTSRNREAFRALSVLEDVCVASVSGQGVDGYRAALERLKEAL